jgi:hypothetical protein
VRFRDALISIASIVLLIALLAIADDRVRDQLARLTPTAVSQQFARGRGEIRTAGVAAHEEIVDSGPLAALVVAGTVLFVCMLRT